MHRDPVNDACVVRCAANQESIGLLKFNYSLLFCSSSIPQKATVGLGIARDHKKIVTVSSRLDIWIFPAIAERKTAMSAGLDNKS